MEKLHFSYENKVSKNIGNLHKAKNTFSKSGLKTLYFPFKHITYIMGILPREASLKQN